MSHKDCFIFLIFVTFRKFKMVLQNLKMTMNFASLKRVHLVLILAR